MDKLDKNLLFELKQSCRISFSDLAQYYNIPPEEVTSRVKRLVDEHIILKFTVILTPALFDVKQAFIFFRSQEIIDLDRITLLGINPAVEYISVGQNIEGFAFIHYVQDLDIEEVLEYFKGIHPSFNELKAYKVVYMPGEITKEPKSDVLALEKVDWLLLSHLREQGRLPLPELAKRTQISIETLAHRLDFLRQNELIDETIHLNPARSHKESWTVFRMELTLITDPYLRELSRELHETFTESFWSVWKVTDAPILLLTFLCSSYTEVEKIQVWLSENPGFKSIEIIMGGTTYYFSDFRDELIEEKRSHGWFSPEQWVDNQEF
ncbi:MAG: winged helix-turn-helix transcriptional regulator [Candidatus Heimdallarchaeota archaeon]|nr:winged helix-turn-helix transcriptional regulator [Candidatus Heimdallarchaeota archaeon]